MNERSESNKFLWLGAILVLALTFAAHFRALQGQFVDWDDTIHITRNVAIRAITPHNLCLMFARPIAKLYCPLTWLSFAVDYQIWGQNPFGYHLTNLFLHLLNTLLVLLLVREVLRDRFRHATVVALLTAAIFGVHPLRVESVAWATERKDVLFTFFYLAALLAYCRWLVGHKWRVYGACFGLFVASALSKSTAISFPIVLIIIDHFLAKRKAWEEKIPFFAVSLLITAITFLAQAGGPVETVATPEIVPLWQRMGLVGYCSLFYVKKFFWPFHLSAVYVNFDQMGWTILTSFGYLAAFSVVTGLIIAARRRWPGVVARVALLSRHTLSHDWTGSGRCPCRRRPLFVHSPDRTCSAPEYGSGLVDVFASWRGGAIGGEPDGRRNPGDARFSDGPTRGRLEQYGNSLRQCVARKPGLSARAPQPCRVAHQPQRIRRGDRSSAAGSQTRTQRRSRSQDSGLRSDRQG